MKVGLVSIIVPVYNVERYLDKCIESILGQTYKNIEVILVNDGSTDSSLDICKQYLFDPRVDIIDKENEGLSSARQAGIDKAQGEYICTVDSDDYIEKSFVEKMYKKISTDKSDICICATRFYSKNNSKIYSVSDNVKSPVKITKSDIESNYFPLLIRYYMSDSWNKIYRTDFIRKSEVRFSLDKEYNGTDLSFNHRLMLYLPQISIINEPLYNHQLLESSRVRRKDKQLQKGFMIIMNQIINEVEKSKFSNRINKQLNCLYVKFLREAAQDVYNLSYNSKDLEVQINNLFNQHEQYLLKQPRLSLSVKHMNTISLKLFCYCLKSKNKLKWYLYLRKKYLGL